EALGLSPAAFRHGGFHFPQKCSKEAATLPTAGNAGPALVETTMAAQALDPLSKLVTVFGGSGFLGRHVVRALARRGYRIRVAVRRPDLAGHLQPLGRV